MDRTPNLQKQLAFIELQKAFRHAHYIEPPAPLEILHVVFAHHASVHHTDPRGVPMQLLDVPNHLFQRDLIVTVASKNFIADRHAAAADN